MSVETLQRLHLAGLGLGHNVVFSLDQKVEFGTIKVQDLSARTDECVTVRTEFGEDKEVPIGRLNRSHQAWKSESRLETLTYFVLIVMLFCTFIAVCGWLLGLYPTFRVLNWVFIDGGFFGLVYLMYLTHRMQHWWSVRQNYRRAEFFFMARRSCGSPQFARATAQGVIQYRPSEKVTAN